MPIEAERLFCDLTTVPGTALTLFGHRRLPVSEFCGYWSTHIHQYYVQRGRKLDPSEGTRLAGLLYTFVQARLS